jgi:DNA-binding beta-propeller fold protein YncE
VAVAPDESFALVASNTKLDAANPKKQIPDNRLSVIDLKAKPPAVIATLETGLGATGTAINPAGTLALVANRNEGHRFYLYDLWQQIERRWKNRFW